MTGPVNFSLLQESRPFVGPTNRLGKRIRGAFCPWVKRPGVKFTYSRHLHEFLKRLNQKLFTVFYARKFVDIGVSRWSCVRTRIHDMLDRVHVSLHHNSGIDRKIEIWPPVLHYLLTPWCRVLLEHPTGLQLVKKFPAFNGIRRFITALTSVRHLSLSWASPIQSIYPHPTFWRSILILSTHLRLGLPSGLFPSGFPIKTLYIPLASSHTRHMPSPSHSSRFYHSHNIG